MKPRFKCPPFGQHLKSLVFDYVHHTSGNVDYEALTAEVKRTFPDSAWKKTHWASDTASIISLPLLPLPSALVLWPRGA